MCIFVFRSHPFIIVQGASNVKHMKLFCLITYECINVCFCSPTVGDTQDGGGDGLFENVPFMSGLGSSAPQTLPSSSATESSLLGGGLFSGLGMGTVPTGSAGMCEWVGECTCECGKVCVPCVCGALCN